MIFPRVNPVNEALQSPADVTREGSRDDALRLAVEPGDRPLWIAAPLVQADIGRCPRAD
jgi:hypothetical protein